MNFKKIAVLAVAVLFLVSCASMRNYRGNTSKDINIEKLSLMLNDSLRRPSLKNKEIGILSFANLNNLKQVEPLGRHIQEKLSHQLFDLGFRIVEIRLDDHVYFVPKVGEINLTRLKEKLAIKGYKDIKALVLGTYLDAGDYVYVNSKFIELENSQVRASGEIKIRKGKYLHKLIHIDCEQDPCGKSEVYERFPVKTKTKKKSSE